MTSSIDSRIRRQLDNYDIKASVMSMMVTNCKSPLFKWSNYELLPVALRESSSMGYYTLDILTPKNEDANFITDKLVDIVKILPMDSTDDCKPVLTIDNLRIQNAKDIDNLIKFLELLKYRVS
jgi:hypothetical protein